MNGIITASSTMVRTRWTFWAFASLVLSVFVVSPLWAEDHPKEKLLTTEIKKLGPLNQEIPDRVIQSIKSWNLPFITQEKLEQIRGEFQQFVEKYEPKDVDESRRQAIAKAVEDPRHFRTFPDKIEKGELYQYFPPHQNAIYLAFPNQIKTLKWKLFMALKRGPLDSESQQHQTQQRKWIRTFIATSQKKVSPKEKEAMLARLDRLFTDPLCEPLDRPMSEEQFQKFQELCKKKVPDSASVISTMISNIFHTRYGDEDAFCTAFVASRPMELEAWQNTLPMFDDDCVLPYVAADCFQGFNFKSLERFGEKMIVLAAPKDGPTFSFLIDLAHETTSYDYRPIKVSRDSDDSGKFRRKDALENDWGDIGYDSTEGGLLFADRGAKLALLDVRNWMEADAISDSDLRAEIQKQAKKSIHFKDFKDKRDDVLNKRQVVDSNLFKTLKFFPYIGVLTKEGYLVVVTGYPAKNNKSVVLKIRAREKSLEQANKALKQRPQ